MKLLATQTVQESVRLDPTKDNFMTLIKEFIAKANAEKDKNFLLFVVCASHGYHAGDGQGVCGPYLDI
jgi:hypothetical protein